jgi:NAD(P)-dependent dehydrogenase (short-subunit alcohol dehydrogenase family)
MTADTIALVTGTNKGIGCEIAGQLAALGVTVLLGARDAANGKRAAAALRERGGDVREIVLDVTDPVTIKDAAARVDDGFGRLDVLVNNAGISGGRGTQRPGAVDFGALRAVFETNLFGVVAVTEAMLPLLRKSAAARIVNVSSGTGSLTWMTDPGHYFASRVRGSVAYPVSKAALNMLTVQYAKSLAAENIAVNAVAPGACATDFTTGLDRVITRTAADGARIAVRLATAAPGGPNGGFHDDDGRVPW